MPLDIDSIEKAVKKAKEGSKKRNFRQSVELIVNLRSIDLKKPEFRLNQQIKFPFPLPIPIRVCVIATGDLALRAKDAGTRIIDKEELASLGANRNAAKKLAGEFDSFVAMAELMPAVGKSLGPVLAPRGKMPRPVPSTVDLHVILEQLKAMTTVQLKKEPIIKMRVGTEDMADDQIAQNAMAIFNVIETKLQRGLGHVRSAFIKNTMGPAIPVEVN